MRNRAKCKLCHSIIESFHRYDLVSCECGAITIDGGNYAFGVQAKVPEAFLRVDDEGNEIIVQFKENEEIQKSKIDNPLKMTKEDKIASLKAHIDSFERLPEERQRDPLNQYDFYISLLLVVSLFEDSK